MTRLGELQSRAVIIAANIAAVTNPQDQDELVRLIKSELDRKGVDLLIEAPATRPVCVQCMLTGCNGECMENVE